MAAEGAAPVRGVDAHPLGDRAERDPSTMRLRYPPGCLWAGMTIAPAYTVSVNVRPPHEILRRISPKNVPGGNLAIMASPRSTPPGARRHPPAHGFPKRLAPSQVRPAGPPIEVDSRRTPASGMTHPPEDAPRDSRARAGG
jgi:hypothetical protein